MSEDVERRLRAALSARADLVTADSLRAVDPVVRTAPERRRRFWPVFLRPVPLGAFAAVVVCTVLLGLMLRPVRDGESVDVATLEGISFTVPDGWQFRPLVEGIGCVQPADAAPSGDTCTPTGVEVRVGEFVGWPQNSLDRDDGWGVDAEDCSAAGVPDPLATVTANRLTARQNQTVDGHPAAYRAWAVSCGSSTVTVRLWWVPDAAVTVYSRGLADRYDATVDQLVGSLRLPRR
ncbi:hypothetical protein AB0M47_03655 [Hamadaea sp. NPDC051192]|uniref:hypothetical protein n=1 Tax=Hamadaea sp. NPDC051192 TaxID=3154940 RepID=UPI00341D27E7